MEIFIGSSSESQKVMDWLAEIVEEEGFFPLRWNKTNLFDLGKPVWPQLVDISQRAVGCIIVMGEDDKVWSRGVVVDKPRDNVLLEHGLFTGSLGLSRSVICRSGSPKFASDLDGIVYLTLGKDKVEKTRNQIKHWLREIREAEDLKQNGKTDADRLARIRNGLTQVFHQHSDDLPSVRIVDHTLTITIDADGNCKVSEKRIHLAEDSSYAMELFTVFGDPPVVNTDQIKFSISAPDPSTSVVELPGIDRPGEKHFLVFFLPKIAAGDEIELDISWEWPGMWRSFGLYQPEVWAIDIPPRWAYQIVKVRMVVHPSLPSLAIRNIGQGGGCFQECKEDAQENLNYRVYSWTCEQPESGTKILLEIRPRS